MWALLSPRAWLVAALTAALVILLGMAYRWGADSVQADWDKATTAQAQETLNVVQAARNKELALTTAADASSKVKNAQIARLNSDLAAALVGLSNRPSRPGPGDLPTPASPGASAGCTGAQLFKQDGEFLVREAARADRLLADLGQCQAAYNTAREALK